MTITKSGLVFACAIAGMVWWVVMASFHGKANLPQWIEVGSLQVVGEVVGPVRRAPDRLVMMIEVDQIVQRDEIRTTSGLLRLTWRDPDHSIHQGDYLEVVARLREPYGTRNPGGFHFGEYLQRKGVHAVATVSGSGHVRVRHVTESGIFSWFWQRIDQWREEVHHAAVQTLREPALGLFLGMIIGEQSFIPPEVRDVFMATGTVHIISISGSHLGLIAFLIFFVVKGAVLRLPIDWLEWLSLRLTATRLAVLITIPVVSFYTLLAGAEIATVRSWVMILLFLLAVWTGREKPLLPALGIAAILALVANPEAIYDISFQLSYSAVLAIAFVIQMNRRQAVIDQDVREQSSGLMERLWQRTRQAWWMTLAVTLATLPLVAYYFNQIAWLGLISNLVVVPFVGFLVIPLGLASVVWVLMTGTSTLPLGFLHQAIADSLVKIVSVFAQIPGAEWHVASPSIVMILLFYSLLISIVLSTQVTKLQVSCGVGVFAILCWWAWSPRMTIDQHTMRVTFLDVGQGDATVIELPDGTTILIDGGPAYTRLNMGQAVIGPYLWDQGIRRIDHVIATHPQWDHVGGLPWVLKSFDVGQYWSNGIAREQAFYQRLQERIQEVGLKERVVIENDQEIARAGPCTFKAIKPWLKIGDTSEALGSFVSGSALNNHSIITRLDCGQHSFLLTADAEKAALSKLNHLSDVHTARVVKVPHHGAKSSLYQEWIDQLEAEVAVVSAGQHNRYGHPHPAVVNAYRENGIPLYRTDQDGAVWVTANLDSSKLTVHTAEERRLQPIHIDEDILANEWKNWQRLWRMSTSTL
ncbi:MAG: DNA internalization-related competence protein ComEC/Rec2 [Nitrospirales bacterium]|nr:MAG: DNA internalization-related competence protein ComEC/Rec2 [Nitrospirales bacterium]